MLFRTAIACLLPAASACAAQQPAAEPPMDAPAPRLVLLGEVHDNAEGHRQRLEKVRDFAGGEADVAIAMEQFDRERQADLDAAMARCADAACVIAAAAPEKAGWNWDYYAPVIQLALDEHLRLLAANLSRADASKVVKDGFAAALSPALVARFGLDQPLPEALLAGQVEAVRSGHCGMLPEEMLAPMARAQVARDVVMADTLMQALASDHRPAYVLLLAGNGHVDREIGVPWWLRGSSEPWVSIGYVEPGDDAAALPYDEVHVVPAVEREDPCAAFGASRASPAGS
jgi:uncharacterized iron-regulated protein